MSQRYYIITLFMNLNQCLFLTVYREWFKSELTTIDQQDRLSFEKSQGMHAFKMHESYIVI